MAVYTDVAAEDLAAFLAGYDIGELLSYKGIAEGVENSNFLVHTSRGYFILTLYEKRVAATDLPFFLGLMEHLHARGITCPQPVKNKQRRGARPGRRPAGRDRHLPRRHVDPPADRRPLRGARRGAGAGCISPASISNGSRAQRAVGRRLAAAVRDLRASAPNEVQRDLQQFLAAELAASRERRGRANLPRRRHPRRSVSRQRVLPRQQAVRA